MNQNTLFQEQIQHAPQPNNFSPDSIPIALMTVVTFDITNASTGGSNIWYSSNQNMEPSSPLPYL
jgi:hypothetical protein